MLMIIAVLVVLGLCLGSFVNALVWRLHEQETEQAKKKPDKNYLQRLSIRKGRSICPDCKHELGVQDLVPVLSWLGLRGKCRYCGRPILSQYPLVEASLAMLFVASYKWWPQSFNTAQKVIFVLWLALLTGLLALLVYDVRWKLLPNRLIYPLTGIAGAMVIISVATAGKPLMALLNVMGAVLIGGGLFYVLFQVSDGKWIGGGDVRLGWLLGLITGTPARSLLFIFLAAFGGSLFSVPLLASGRLKRTSVIPFGPFLIAGAIIVQLFGGDVLHWYRHTFLAF
jgi:prepilin signal peptidase PulO-like enzyme (type II secretory pathway)